MVTGDDTLCKNVSGDCDLTPILGETMIKKVYHRESRLVSMLVVLCVAAAMANQPWLF